MKERTMETIKAYVIGGVGGALIVLIGGFWIGPLTTNGTLQEAVNAAVVDQQAAICAERGQADPTFIGAIAFKALQYRDKRDFANRHAEFPGQSSRMNRDVLNACSNILGSA